MKAFIQQNENQVKTRKPNRVTHFIVYEYSNFRITQKMAFLDNGFFFKNHFRNNHNMIKTNNNNTKIRKKKSLEMKRRQARKKIIRFIIR